MKTALFFLLLALSTQHLSLAEHVLDYYGNPLNDYTDYHILLASNTAYGIQVEEVSSETCPVSVVMGIDPKYLTFKPKEGGIIGSEFSIGDPLYINFVHVSPCATSSNWTVEVAGESQYPVLIGPPEGTISMPGTFKINKAKDNPNAYNIAFDFVDKDEHLLYTKTDENNVDILLVNLCGDEATDVVFVPFSRPVPPPPPPPPPPPTTSTFVPLIRKRVA